MSVTIEKHTPPTPLIDVLAHPLMLGSLGPILNESETATLAHFFHTHGRTTEAIYLVEAWYCAEDVEDADVRLSADETTLAVADGSGQIILTIHDPEGVLRHLARPGTAKELRFLRDEA